MWEPCRVSDTDREVARNALLMRFLFFPALRHDVVG